MQDANMSAPLIGCEAKIIRAGQWIRCRLAEISPRGALLQTDVELAIGDKVVACIGEVGAMAGAVAEIKDGLYAVVFKTVSAQSLARMPGCYARG